MKRECPKCNEVKELHEFYKTDKTCKTCRKKARLLKKLDPEWVEKERKRSREKYHRLNYKERKQTKNKYTIIKNYNSRFPEKRNAYILSQRIKVPKGFQRHHWSYNEQHVKDIIPLSVRDHNQLHRFLHYDSDRMMYRTVVKIDTFIQDELLDTKEKHQNYFIALQLSDLWE